MPDPSVHLGAFTLKNPVIAASGTFGFGEEYSELYDVSCLGGVCSKGLTLRPREGNPPPRLWETSCGLLNSIGLQNPGVDAFIREELPRMKGMGLTVIANVWGGSVDEYGEAVERLSNSPVDAIEVNISCPNVPGGAIRGEQMKESAQVVREVRRVCEKPLWVKLPPEAGVAVARAVQEQGAEAICAVNTFRALAIDIERGEPVFSNTFAGLSGPAIKPLALRVVYELAAALAIPVVGIGGITDWRDAVEFIMAGAWAVQVGTGNFIDPLCSLKVVEGLNQFMKRKNLNSWEEIRGCAHR
jgi:dihydroorotate dehydrogenase (NAD+) catalytic subunit